MRIDRALSAHRPLYLRNRAEWAAVLLDVDHQRDDVCYDGNDVLPVSAWATQWPRATTRGHSWTTCTTPAESLIFLCMMKLLYTRYGTGARPSVGRSPSPPTSRTPSPRSRRSSAVFIPSPSTSPSSSSPTQRTDTHAGSQSFVVREESVPVDLSALPTVFQLSLAHARNEMKSSMSTTVAAEQSRFYGCYTTYQDTTTT